MKQVDRYIGSLIGLAAGDALGTSCEFLEPGTFVPICDMVGGGPFKLKAGEWTDDTSMALCLAESLLESGGFDPVDQMKRYLSWYRKGYLSSNGRVFDIGRTVRIALTKFEKTGEPFCGETDPLTSGNGSLMRLAPIPLFFAKNFEVAIALSAESSKTTHASRASVDACRFFAGLILGALQGETKERLLSRQYSPVEGLWRTTPLCQEIDDIASGSYKKKKPPAIAGRGYVVKTLEAALWAFYTTDDFRSGCLKAVNLGNDADTTAAIFGQLAGCHYGVNNIPVEWLEKLAKRDLIESIARDLYVKSIESC